MQASWFKLVSFSIIVACALQSTCAHAGAQLGKVVQRDPAEETEEILRSAHDHESKFDGTSFAYGVGAGIALERFGGPVSSEIQAWATRIRTGQVRNQNDFWALGAVLIVGVPLIKYGITKISERLSARAQANKENLIKTEMNQALQKAGLPPSVKAVKIF